MKSAPFRSLARFRRMAALLAIVCWFGALPAAAQSASDVIRRGNEAFDAGRFEEALAIYNEVPEAGDRPPPVELLHNRAAALFKLGRTADAREAWVRAAGQRDAKFEAACRYNIGNTHYAEAIAHATAGQPSAKAAMESLGKAIEQYRDALRIDPQLASARANLELAAQLLKALELMSQNEDPQPGSQPSQDQQQQQPQPSSQPNERDPNQPADPNSDNPPDQSGEEPREPSDDDSSQQPQDNPDSQPGDPNQSQPPQGEAQTQPVETPQASQPANDAEPAQPEEVRMTEEEARRLLQKIRDAEKARREALLRRMRGPRPVDRDW